MKDNNAGINGGTDEKKVENKYGLHQFFNYIKRKFDLDHDNAQQEEVVENISKGVEFAGTNLWILIFATFVASLGLNVNSAAVIIGAMLISPLMGPIMGIGLSLGINDFELMKRSFRNFLLMVVVSIVASTLFFIVSPLSDAKSELLARTSPTVYDVLIAFFGGLAGIVAQSRKDRTSTVIPGVAIATALMPPLCTAGYGLATQQFNFFFGAFYLFFINTVFIAIATYIIVRFLKYRKKVFLDKARERRVKNYMAAIVVLTLVPSVFMAYDIIQETIFNSNADRFVKEAFSFQNTQVIDYSRHFKTRKEKSNIKIILIGEPLSDDAIENARALMVEAYGLRDTELTVRQSTKDDKIDFSTLATTYTQLLDEKNRQIEELQAKMSGWTEPLEMNDISREAAMVVDNLGSIAVSQHIGYSADGNPVDTLLVGIVTPQDRTKGIDTAKLARWLGTRIKSGRVKMYVEPASSSAPARKTQDK